MIYGRGSKARYLGGRFLQVCIDGWCAPIRAPFLSMSLTLGALVTRPHFVHNHAELPTTVGCWHRQAAASWTGRVRRAKV